MSTTFESDWENTRLKERIEELERTWLSPEAYETLMRERQEILHELNEQVRLSEWQQLVQERDALQADNAELVAALKPFGAIDLVESRLPAEFAMLILRARAALAKAIRARSTK